MAPPAARPIDAPTSEPVRENQDDATLSAAGERPVTIAEPASHETTDDAGRRDAERAEAQRAAEARAAVEPVAAPEASTPEHSEPIPDHSQEDADAAARAQAAARQATAATPHEPTGQSTADNPDPTTPADVPHAAHAPDAPDHAREDAESRARDQAEATARHQADVSARAQAAAAREHAAHDAAEHTAPDPDVVTTHAPDAQQDHGREDTESRTREQAEATARQQTDAAARERAQATAREQAAHEAAEHAAPDPDLAATHAPEAQQDHAREEGEAQAREQAQAAARQQATEAARLQAAEAAREHAAELAAEHVAAADPDVSPPAHAPDAASAPPDPREAPQQSQAQRVLDAILADNHDEQEPRFEDQIASAQQRVESETYWHQQQEARRLAADEQQQVLARADELRSAYVPLLAEQNEAWAQGLDERLANIQSLAATEPRAAADELRKVTDAVREYYGYSPGPDDQLPDPTQEPGSLLDRVDDDSRLPEGRIRMPAAWRGDWDGAPGDSRWAPHNLGAYGLEQGQSVQWREGVPDFTEHAVSTPSGRPGVLSVKSLDGDPAEDRVRTMKQLAQQEGMTFREVEEWIRENDIRIHHFGGRDMQLVPGRLHDALAHNGGASELRERRWPPQ